LVFFNKGSGTHRIDFSDYPVAKNLIYFLSPGRIHEMKPDNQEGFVIAFPKDILYDIQATENVSVSQLFYYPDNNYSVDISLGHVPTLHNLVALLEYEAAKPNQNQKLVRNYLSALLINCLECRGLSNPVKIDDRIIKLRMEINKSYITQRSGSYYAKKVYLSLKHLNDLSLQTLGKTVTQLIHERLLLEAKREIVYTDNSIKEIAYKLRFKDPAYFNRFFKNLEGMTPNEFRKISK
jgi:AraC-like DNA-binding protein